MLIIIPQILEMMSSIIAKLRHMPFLLGFIFFTMLFVISTVPNLNFLQSADAAYIKAKPTSSGPSIKDPNLRVEIVFKNGGKLGYSNHKHGIPWTK